MSQPQTAHSQRSPLGLLGALLVLVVLLLVYVGLQALKGDQPTTATPTVDYAADVAPARKAATFPLVAPPTLPAGWRATSVGFTPAPGSHWHLGVLTDKDRYVGLEQSLDTVAEMVTTYVDDNPSRGAPIDVAGQSWATYSDSGGDLALVRRQAGATTLVVGHDVPRDQLESYTASLR